MSKLIKRILKSKMLKLQKVENLLLFLTILFLPTQLGKHFWPKFSYIYSLKIDYLSPTFYFWDILAIGLLVVWILQKPKINKLALNLLLFFLFAQALSVLGVQNAGASLVRLEQYILAGFFGVYLASCDFKEKFGRIYLPLVLSLGIEAGVAVLQFIHGSTLGLWILGERSFTLLTPGIAKFDFNGLQVLRPYATFPHPNVLAGFLLVGLSILYQGLMFRSRVFKAALISGGIAIFLTMSRTAILAGFITTAIFLRKKSKNLVIFIAVLTVTLSPILFTRFSSLLNFDNLTFVRREELAGSAWQMFLKYPAFGVGLNNFIPAQANNLVSGPSRFLQPVHNIFMLALSETGIVGFMGLIFLIGYPIRKLISYRVSLIALLSWFIIIFLGMFDHYFLTLPQGYRLLFLVWGLSFSLSKSKI